jgi:hypothetical protein
MLLFIIIPVVFIAFLLYQYAFYTRTYYIGQSVHKFRELRCEVTLSLSSNVKKNLSIKEALEHQRFLLQLDAIIKHFDQLSPEFFKFNTLRAAIYSSTLFTSEKSATRSNYNPILLQYKAKLKECILTAFKAVPFIRLRLFLFFFRVLARLSIKLGFGRYKKHVKVLELFLMLEKESSGKNAFPYNF